MNSVRIKVVTPHEERFSSPVPIISSISSHQDVDEKAVRGILKEGTAIGKAKEAEWLVQRLSEVKKHGGNVKADWRIPIPSEIFNFILSISSIACL